MPGTAQQQRPIRIAVVTSLYPNSRQPRHGIFVERRLRHLLASGDIEARVIAPVPWFWSTHPRYGRYAELAQVAAVEQRHGIEVRHPRYAVVPKIGMTLGPASMAACLRRALTTLRADGFDFDLVDAHYFYPDGVAAARAARALARPCTITARGTDINRIAGMRVPAAQIRAAAAAADGLIAVSQSLADRLGALVEWPDKIVVLRNGVDLAHFAPGDRCAVRDRLGIGGRIWLGVGNLVASKGFDLAIAALRDVPKATLLLVGEGPEAKALAQYAQRLGVADRVHFLGLVAPQDLAPYYNAADALILPSASEGMPNVVLEALACGTAVIATPVGGIPEIVAQPTAGRLMAEHSAAAIVAAWANLDAAELDAAGRAARRAYARAFDWSATTRGQLDLFRRILARPSTVAASLEAGG